MDNHVLSFKYWANFKLQVIKVLNGMGKLKEYSDTFENLSEAIVKYLLRDVDAERQNQKKMVDMISLLNVKMGILENVHCLNAN